MDKIPLKLFNKRFPLTYCCEIDVPPTSCLMVKAVQQVMLNVSAVLPLNY